MISSSTLISSMPMLMPALSGMAYTGNGLPRGWRTPCASWRSVFMRMPNHATP